MGLVSANAQWWPELRKTYDQMAMLRALRIVSLCCAVCALCISA